jgi:predicted transcriptional regulator
MATMKVGIASYEEMKARTMRIVRGEQAVQQDDPRIWFTSVESFAKISSEESSKLFQTLFQDDDSDLIEHNPEFVR